MSSPAVISAIEEIEKKYGVGLAATVMKVMVKDINDMVGYFMREFKLSEERSRALSDELNKRVFASVSDYLGFGQAIGEKRIFPSGENGGQLVKAEMKRESPAVFSAVSHDLLFSPEDQKEIGELAKKVGDYAKSTSRPAETDENLEQIIKNTRINFPSEDLAERFKRILKIYLRGIRDRIETKQTLIKPIESGGLGIDDETAGNILSIADGNLKSLNKNVIIKKPRKINVEEDEIESAIKYKEAKARNMNQVKEIGPRDVEYDFVSAGKNKKELLKFDTAHELAPPAPAIANKPAAESLNANIEKHPDALLSAEPKKSFKKSAKSILPKFFKKRKMLIMPDTNAKPPVKPAISALPQFRNFVKTGQSGKIKMEDVKFQPKIMGPIDELRYMQLIDFRRLDADPLKAAEKIKDKISLLDSEYSKRLEGIKAWRLSPVNRLYLKMGASGISRKTPIDAIIEERKSAGNDYLNNQEFEAIIDLNKKLRF